MNRARFTKNKIRFVVTENDVKFYRRNYNVDGYGTETEHAVTPQYAGTLRKKYASVIDGVRKTLNG